MKPERELLELLEADAELKHTETMFDGTRRMFAINERMAEEARQRNAQLGVNSVQEAKAVQRARERVEALRRRSKEQPA